jgi:hypothetical protein
MLSEVIMYRIWCEFTDNSIVNVIAHDWAEVVKDFTKVPRKLVVTKLLVRDNRQLDLL